MIEFDLGRRFDVVTCLFSSIGYVLTLDRLDRAVANMAAHLETPGVLIVEPWFTPDQWEPGHVGALFADEDDFKVARMNISEPAGDTCVMVFHYLVGTPGGVEYFDERHELGMFTHDQYVAAFERAGLRVHHDEWGLMGRGLYVATH
jgi:hypothetical protein